MDLQDHSNEDLQAAFMATLPAQSQYTTLALTTDKHNNNGPQPHTPGRVYTLTGPSHHLFALFERTQLTLNLVGSPHAALVLRPLPSPSNANPPVKVFFDRPDRPTNVRQAYQTIQALALHAQAPNPTPHTLSLLAAALNPTSIKLVPPQKTGPTTIVYLHLAHSQADSVLVGLSLRALDKEVTVTFRMGNLLAKTPGSLHLPLKYEVVALQLKIAPTTTRTAEVDLYVAALNATNIAFHPAASSPYQPAGGAAVHGASRAKRRRVGYDVAEARKQGLV